MTIDEVVTELTMSYSHKLHLILEGDDDRQLLLSVISNEAVVNTVCVYGADRVIETIEAVEADPILLRTLKVLGVIDRDYREPLKTLPTSANILITDHRDIECMMIDSPVFTRVLRELGSSEKVIALGGASAVKGKITGAGRVLGELRYYSQSSHAPWTFKKLDFSKVIDRKTLVFDESKLLNHLSTHQGTDKVPISSATISAAKQACKKAKCLKKMSYFSHDFLICRGHDLMGIFGLALRSFCGSQNAPECTIERIETLFRVGYGPYFSRSKLFKNMSTWLAINGLAQDIALQ
jgi:hypothetical protein